MYEQTASRLKSFVVSLWQGLMAIPRIKGTLVLTTDRIIIISLLMAVMSYGVYAQALIASEDMNLQAGPPVGGDYVAFWGAAKAVTQGEAAEIYEMKNFEEHLLEEGPPRERYGLTWQYPPTYYFFVLPLALTPFFFGYVLWTFGTFALFLGVMRKTMSLQWTGVFLIAALPVCFNAVITGQNGFLTASLLVLAVAMPDKRPIMAGIAAGLLTFKPQLGVLLPFAYMAAGCWRAFFTAGITALLMVAASIGVFGIETWQAFINSIINVSEGVKNAVYPIHKMPTVYAAFHKSGVPQNIAMILQGLAAFSAIGLILYVWRKVKDWELRAAILIAAAFLCTPYAYYYEMTILVFPAVVLVRQALRTGFLRFEELSLALLWAIPIFLPGLSKIMGAQLGLAMVLLLLGMLLRRAFFAPAEIPQDNSAEEIVKESVDGQPA